MARNDVFFRYKTCSHKLNLKTFVSHLCMQQIICFWYLKSLYLTALDGAFFSIAERLLCSIIMDTKQWCSQGQIFRLLVFKQLCLSRALSVVECFIWFYYFVFTLACFCTAMSQQVKHITTFFCLFVLLPSSCARACDNKAGEELPVVQPAGKNLKAR